MTGPPPEESSPPEVPPIGELAEQLADLRAVTSGIGQRLREHGEKLDEVVELLEDGGARSTPSPAAPAVPPEPAPPVGTAHPSEQAAPPGAQQQALPGMPAEQPEAPDGSEESDLAPTFILLFDAGSPEEEQELLALDEWIRVVLVPTYVNDVSSRRPWCDRWWEHPEAVARLHALWLAWQELTDEAAGGHTGPSIWHRDHLDDAMARLRSHDGPFAGCMIDSRAPAHRPDRTTPVQAFSTG